jgi:hypothetical protein
MKKSKKNFMRLFIGLGVFVAGVAMLFFKQTHSLAPFLVGFGATFAAMNAKGD